MKKTIFIGAIILVSLPISVSSLSLSKAHFGAQDPTNNPAMPKNLELVRPSWIFNWDFIEPEKGKYDWSDADDEVKRFQKKAYHILGVIVPYTNWDQKKRNDYQTCKTEYDEAEKWGIEYICNPHSWKAYRKFLRKMVERYDGDGKKDMPGLKMPIRAWEVSNEPEFEQTYYSGTPAEYAKLLKVTYNTIKKADKKAKVLNGGIAGMTEDIDFWEEVFTQPGGKKFDVLSYHCITCQSETASIKEFNEWLEENNVSDKEIWLTEWQIGNLDNSFTDEETALMAVKGAAYAFAHNVDKIFWVEFSYLSEYTKAKEALKTLVKKLKNFETATVNTEFMSEDEEEINVGVYEFRKENKVIYVAWGGGTLTIGGTITSAIDIYGNPVTIENNIANLVETPYIIEVE